MSPAKMMKLLQPLLEAVWEEGHQQGLTDGATYDTGGKYQGNPYKERK